MKALRFITAILLFATGALHVFYFIQEPRVKGSAAVLIFGFIYFVIGILLLLKMKYSRLSGIIFPLIGLIYGLITFDPTKTPPLMNILGILDILIIVLCSILVWERKRKA